MPHFNIEIIRRFIQREKVTYFLLGVMSFLTSQLVCRYSRNSPYFAEPDCSLPFSKACVNLGQPNPFHIITFRNSILILSTHPRLGLPSGLLPSGFPPKNLYTISPYPYATHAQPISFFSILSPSQYLVQIN